MADQLACDINFFYYIRFFFGFYHKFQSSRQIRWLAKCYCCLIYVNIIFFFNYLKTYRIYPKLFIYFISVEYLVFISISLLEGNKYLLKYYKKKPLIDASASTYGPMRVCLFAYMCLMLLVKLLFIIEVSIVHREYTTLEHLFNIFGLITWYVIIIGRSPSLFVFALLYTRVRLMRQTLENNDFDCRNQGKNHPRRYMQMYEAIMDGLKEYEGPKKLQRDHEEIQKLFQFLESNTLEYCVWRVLPLNLRSLLSFLSFTITNSIAILQIQDWAA
ncbi:hypothetical protein O3G_MSEX013132 [Manduca sexta]|uniref:Gustatory receptor 22 n=1 Tax=Manduca sexta TaxID=7130 RepID=A0A5K8B259_MANSE|nr:hypothetical protein O3G_MSEX013132 [Manduca sexta]CUQ99363.1 TPA: Gustatory receptor 22 [Manduca sexta]